MTHKKCGDFNGKKRRTNEPCGQVAGWGTDHPGEGKCKLHGGASSGRPVEHGRYSVKHRQSLNKKVERFHDDPEPGNMASELFLIRALLQDYLDRFPEGIPLTFKSIAHIYDMVESISRLMERITRMINQTALTISEVQLLQSRFADLVVKYIQDEQRIAEFWNEFRSYFDIHRRSTRTLTDGGREDQEPSSMAGAEDGGG